MPDTGWLGPKTDHLQSANRRVATTTGDYPSVMPRSAVRYRPTPQEPQITQRGGRQVMQIGNKEYLAHRGYPKWRAILPAGLGASACLLFMLFWNIGSGAVGNWQTDSKYGYPRTFRMEAVVGHGDSELRPSEFVFLNLLGHIYVFEYCGGGEKACHVYAGPTLGGDSVDKIPVRGEFADENTDGKPDMVILVNDQRIVYLNDGKEFKQ